MSILRIAVLLLISVFSSQVLADTLLSNGDFSQTTSAFSGGVTVAGNNHIPVDWAGLLGQTDNAGVYNGELLFSTAGAHNPNLHKYYVYQQFSVLSAGDYTLTFDYKLQDAYSATAINGAKINIDNWYSNTNTIFKATYGDEVAISNANGVPYGNWHYDESATFSLAAGLHTLYIGTIGASQVYARGAVIYDNLNLTPVAAVPEPDTYALIIAGLGLIGFASERKGRIAVSD